MANQRMQVGLIVLLLAALCAGAAAQSSSCTNTLITLSPCLNYITGNSSSPSSSCCTQLASVVKSQPECLCEAVKNGGTSLGLNINQTLALNLPTACKVSVPSSVGSCIAASPTTSPPGSAESPSSGSGSKSTPTTDTSSGNSIKISASLFSIIMVAFQFASAFISI